MHLLFGNEELILKATYANDDMYMTEDGKYIIFRNIRGKIVPIETDSADYADWLITQGVQINPSDQGNLAQIESYLDQLTRVRELGGPEAEAKYEQQLVDYLKQKLTASQGMGYDQALAAKAKQQGVTSQELTQRYKDQYDKNKGNEINASKDRSKEWEYFISHYTDDMLSRSPDQRMQSTEWGVIKAFDLTLMMGMEQAKNGVPPSQVKLLKMLEEEIKSRTAAAKYFDARYDPKTTDEDYNLAAISVLDGLENLRDLIERDTDFGKGIEASFNKIYAKMFSDFDKPNKRNLNPLSKNTIPDHDFDVPDELPQNFTVDEASSLMSIFKAHAGSKLPITHSIMMHVMSRLFDQIPHTASTKVAVDFANPDKGIHQLHKTQFFRGFADFRDGNNAETDVEEILEQALRKAIKLSESTNPTELASGIKTIVALMGVVDGYYAAKNNKSVGVDNKDGIRKLWHNSPMEGGRQKGKGEGPNLNPVFQDQAARVNAQFDNKTLKIIHGGRAPQVTPRAAVDHAINNPEVGTPNVAPPENMPTAAEGHAGEEHADVTQHYDRKGSRFIDKQDGHMVDIKPNGVDPVSGLRYANIEITTPQGKVIAPDDKVYVPKDPKEQARFFRDALNLGRKYAKESANTQHGTTTGTPEIAPPTTPANPTAVDAPRSAGTSGAKLGGMSDAQHSKLRELAAVLQQTGVSLKPMGDNKWIFTMGKSGSMIHPTKGGLKFNPSTGVFTSLHSDVVLNGWNDIQKEWPSLVDGSAEQKQEAATLSPDTVINDAVSSLKITNAAEAKVMTETLAAIKASGKYTAKIQREDKAGSNKPFSRAIFITLKTPDGSNHAVRISTDNMSSFIAVTNGALEDGDFHRFNKLPEASADYIVGNRPSKDLLGLIEKYLNGSDAALANKVAEKDANNAMSSTVTDSLDSSFEELAEIHDVDYPEYVRRLKDHAAKHNTTFKELNDYMKKIDRERNGEDNALIQ